MANELVSRLNADDKSGEFLNNPKISVTDPASLPPVYALVIRGDCMEPVAPEGSLAVFDSGEPVARGCLAALFYRPEVVPSGRQPVQLKLLMTAPSPYMRFPYRQHPDSTVEDVLLCSQRNPAEIISVRCADLLAVHACVAVMSPEEFETFNAGRPE